VEEDSMSEVEQLRAHVEKIESKVDDLNHSIKDLAEAWKTAQTLVAFMKWLAGIGAALLVMKAAWDGWIK
jgi:prefoldin subunit 5